MRYVSGLILCLFANSLVAATVWTGATIEFEKPPFSDPTVVQDRLTDTVIFARGRTQGLYNAALESSYDKPQFLSPAGTEWAFAGLNDNPTGAAFGAAQYPTLSFLPWAAALGGPGTDLVSNITNRPGVVHLLDDDIYLDLTFTSWGVQPGSGAPFAYTRVAPALIPLPPAWILLLSGIGALRYARRA